MTQFHDLDSAAAAAATTSVHYFAFRISFCAKYVYLLSIQSRKWKRAQGIYNQTFLTFYQ